MAADVSEIQVFIASPSDLADERAALRTLEATLNVNFASAGIRVRFSGWEEVPPGYGRPQAQINPLVDECDIFIGMLRRKWGTATGEHESGFIEEFERAGARRQETRSDPEIALYFAAVTQGELNDAGPDLTKVLNFRKRIETEHIALYSTFVSPEDLARQVADLLNRHLIQRVLAQRAPSPPEGAASGGLASDLGNGSQQVADSVGDGAKELDTAGVQIIATLDSFRDLVRGHKPEVPLDRDRFELIGTALGRDEEALGTHLVNRLYRRRRELELIYAEHICWCRTLLDDIGLRPDAADRVVSGWALFDRGRDSAAQLLLQFAKGDGSVSRGALRSLHRLKMRPAEIWPPALRPRCVGNKTDEDDSVTTDAERATSWVEILNSHPGSGVALDYLLQDIDTRNEDTAAAVGALLTQLLGREQLNESSTKLVDSACQALAGDPEALADALGYSSDDNAQWRLVLRHVERLSPKLLNQFAGHQLNRRAKLAAIGAGLAARTLSDSTLKNLLVLDDDQEVADLLIQSVREDADRALHFVTLIRDGDKKLSSAESEARLMAVAVAPEDLRRLQATMEYSIRPWEALSYSAADDLVDDAREVLRSDAAALRAELAPKLGEEHKVLVDYLARDQLRAAANLLSRQQTPTVEDIDLLLSWFAQEATRGFLYSGVWRVMIRIANGNTIGIITQTIRPYVGVLGFRQSIEHLDSPLAAAIAAVVIEEDADNLSRAQALHWRMQQPERTNEELREALYAEEAIVRLTAAKALIARLDRDELKMLQDEYPRVEGRFWYNVIALFDEQLYAPTPSD